MEVDPFILDYGSSVTVHEELRKAIRTEIEEVESSIEALQNNCKIEEKTAVLLSKDFSHAFHELTRLNREAAEDFEQVKLREHLQMRLRESLQTDVSAVIIAPLNQDEEIRSSIQNQASPESRKVLLDTFDNSEKNLSIGVQKYTMEMTNLAALLAQEQSDCNALISKLSVLKDDTSSLKERLRNDAMKLQTDVQKQLESLQEENESERQRLRNTKDLILRARQRSGQHAQEITKKSELLASIKMINLTTEEHLKSEISRHEQLIQVLQTDERQASDSLKKICEQITCVNRQIAEHIDLSIARTNLEAELVYLRRTRDEKQQKSDEAGVKLEETKRRFHQAELELKDAEEKHQRMEAFRAKNDLTEQVDIETARCELTSLVEEENNIAKSIFDLHEKIQSQQQEEKMMQENRASAAIHAKISLDEAIAKLDSKKADTDRMKKLMLEEKASHDADINEKRSLIASLMNAIDSQEKTIQESIMFRANTVRERLESLKIDFSKRRDYEMFKLDVIRGGVKVIEDSDLKVARIRSSTLPCEDHTLKID